MYYTIRQMAQMFGVTEHTLRFYTDQGLLPCTRDSGNRRVFDEESVVLHTTKGVLVIRGQQLHLQTLSIDGGQVAVDGTVDAMSYEEAQRKGGLFSRLLR